METFSSHLHHLISSLRSYPTYEEWKPIIFHLPFLNLVKRSYPTYEEWKLRTFFFGNKITDGSYPTYEEWKRTKTVLTELGYDLFLSYL